MLFSVMVIPIFIPINCTLGFLFSHISPTLINSCLLDDGHSNWYEMMDNLSILVFLITTCVYISDSITWMDFRIRINWSSILKF